MGRQLAAELFVDRCTIRREAGQSEDPDGQIITVYDPLYVDQPCRVQLRGAWGQSQRVAEAQVVLLQAELQLPHTVTGLRVGDQVLITAAAHDQQLVGRELEIRDIPDKSHATMRRYMVTEITG
jgi:hypothetical protein